MAGEIFEKMRKRALREHRHSIIRSARNGHKAKGRGLVLVKLTNTGTVHLSYLTLTALKQQRGHAGPESRDDGALLIEKLSAYSPDSEIPVMVTDGESKLLLFGRRQAPRPIKPARL
jgi:hypothetical protein